MLPFLESFHLTTDIQNYRYGGIFSIIEKIAKREKNCKIFENRQNRKTITKT